MSRREWEDVFEKAEDVCKQERKESKKEEEKARKKKRGKARKKKRGKEQGDRETRRRREIRRQGDAGKHEEKQGPSVADDEE